MTRAERYLYRLKKWYVLYPGVVAPVSAEFLGSHYEERRQSRSVRRVALDAVVGSAFQLWAPFRARSVARKFGLDRRWARRASKIARRRFVDPNDLALFRITSSEELDLYLRRYEHAAINKRINPAGWAAECSLTDKRRFYARCAEHGLPHPPVLATIENGKITVAALPAQAALALKPASGEGGSGFRLLDYPGWEKGDAASFTKFLARETGGLKEAWLVQPKVVIDPALADIALKALPTVRVTTVINEAGEPEIVTSVLRFPSDPKSEVDNIKAGGLMAPVEADTGRLGAACRGRGMGEFESHPISGATIVGRQLPHWPEARELVFRAHREVFREYNLVGWDVALTAEGALLIEGNGKPCMIVAQRANRRGVGATRFGELIAYHLRAGRG